MPNIAEYNATGEITPSDKGIQAAEVAGRRLGQFGSQIDASLKGIGDKVEQHDSLVEVSHLARHMSDGEAALADTWSQTTTDPQLKDRPDLASTFMKEKVEPFIEQMQALAKTHAGKEYALQTGDRMRQTFWRQTAGDQAAINGNVVQENASRVGNNATVSAARDASQQNYDAQLDVVQKTADTFAAALHPRPGEAGQVGEWHQQYIAQHSRDVVIAHYQSQAEAITQEIGQTGDETKSAALAAAKAGYAADLKGRDYVRGPEWVALGKELDEAAHRGQELYNSKKSTFKAELTEAGKADYSTIHTAITALALKGQGPTPELLNAIGRYSKKYGSTNPGEVASLDDYTLRGADRAQEGKVEPFDPRMRDAIQGGMSLSAGDPRRPTLPSLTQAWSHGQITREDLNNYTEILNKLDKPETDPTFKPAWGNFERWQTQMVQSIGTKGGPGTAAARAQFLHDSTASFMAQGHGGTGWDKALDSTTNAQNPHSFAHVMDWYNKAADHNAEWIQQHDQFRPGATTAPAYGSKAAPVYPPRQGAPAQPKKLDDKAVDAAFGVK